MTVPRAHRAQPDLAGAAVSIPGAQVVGAALNITAAPVKFIGRIIEDAS